MLKMMKQWMRSRNLTRTFRLNGQVLGSRLDMSGISAMDRTVRRSLGRSLMVRHLDVGSNNAEEAELVALGNPIYDLSQYGVDFTASPRHADVLAVTGPVTRHLLTALKRTYDATPHPKIVMAMGDGACYGTPFEITDDCLGPVDRHIPVDIYIPGDPPTPEEIIEAFLLCKQKLLEKPE